MTKDKALELALEALEYLATQIKPDYEHNKAITAIKAALKAKDEPDAYGYAKRLAEAIWSKHYKTIAPQWEPFDELIGVLTQIDNMTAGLISTPQQEAKDEPWEKFCDSNCVWTDHHPDCKLAKDEPVALVVYRGEICYKSTDDDQSFGMWCPVNYDSKHEFEDGTKFYTTPPQQKAKDEPWEQFYPEMGKPYAFEASMYPRVIIDPVTGNVSIGTVKKPCGLECDCTDVCKQDDYKALWQQMCERCDELDKKLAQQEAKDEPVAWNAGIPLLHPKMKEGETISVEYVELTPPQRTWVGLTDEEIKSQWAVFWEDNCHPWAIDFARAIENKLRELNT
jgi:hypothetical protein